jgi:hypothetical protein
VASLAQSYLDKDSEREYVEEDAVMSEGGGSSSPSATAAGERTEAARTLATELQPAPLSGRLGSSATEMGLKLSFDLAEPGPRPEPREPEPREPSRAARLPPGRYQRRAAR